MRRAASFAVLGALLAASSAFAASPPNNGYIGLFNDNSGTDCNVKMNKSGNGKAYVIMVTAGATSGGVSGAAFKISVEAPQPGATSAWNPAGAVSGNVGNPVDNGSGGGTMVTFSSCQTVTGLAGDHIVLGTVNFYGMTGEHLLKVKPSDTIYNSNFDCPSVLLCDGPAYTQVALTLQRGDSALGGEDPVSFVSVVNGSSTSGTSCGFVATQPSSWSSVKGLFR
jgi:hypothetical protein